MKIYNKGRDTVGWWLAVGQCWVSLWVSVALVVGMWPASLAGNHGYTHLAQIFFSFHLAIWNFLPEIFLIKSGCKSTVEQSCLIMTMIHLSTVLCRLVSLLKWKIKTTALRCYRELALLLNMQNVKACFAVGCSFCDVFNCSFQSPAHANRTIPIAVVSH